MGCGGGRFHKSYYRQYGLEAGSDSICTCTLVTLSNQVSKYCVHCYFYQLLYQSAENIILLHSVHSIEMYSESTLM